MKVQALARGHRSRDQQQEARRVAPVREVVEKLESLICETDRQGIDRSSRSGPMIPEAGQHKQAQEKRRNYLLISPLDDGLTRTDQPDGKAADDWWGRLHR